MVTTETGRLFFQRPMKHLPWARKENVWGTWQNACAHIPLRCVAQNFSLPFFSVVALWLSLLVQHDKDKGYRPCFSHG